MVNIIIAVLAGIVAGLVLRLLGRRLLFAVLLGVASFLVLLGITFKLNPPPPPTTVPNVIGYDRDAAVFELTRAGYKCELEDDYNNETPTGKIFRQLPVGGTKLNKGASVKVWVSSGKMPSPPEPGVVITHPRDGDRVGFMTPVTGRSSQVPAGTDIWIVICPRSCPQYHPQTTHADVRPDGTWQVIAYVGARPDTDIDEVFDIHAVLADQIASSKFKAYLETAAKDANWPGMHELPQGARIVNTITVTRRRG